MTKFEEMAKRMQVLNDICATLESNRKMYEDWSNEEGTAYNEEYSFNADIYAEVIKLLEKTYLK